MPEPHKHTRKERPKHQSATNKPSEWKGGVHSHEQKTAFAAVCLAYTLETFKLNRASCTVGWTFLFRRAPQKTRKQGQGCSREEKTKPNNESQKRNGGRNTGKKKKKAHSAAVATVAQSLLFVAAGAPKWDHCLGGTAGSVKQQFTLGSLCSCVRVPARDFQLALPSACKLSRSFSLFLTFSLSRFEKENKLIPKAHPCAKLARHSVEVLCACALLTRRKRSYSALKSWSAIQVATV